MISLAHSGDYSGIVGCQSGMQSGLKGGPGVLETIVCRGTMGREWRKRCKVYYLENVPTKQFEVTSEKITEKKHFNVTKKIVQLVKSNRVCKIM